MSECMRCCPANCKCGCHGDSGKSEWISVKKKPPKISTWVLVFANTTDPDIDCDPQIFVAARGLRGESPEFYDCAHGDGYIAEEFEITYWMPLPDPPHDCEKSGHFHRRNKKVTH